MIAFSLKRTLNILGYRNLFILFIYKCGEHVLCLFVYVIRKPTSIIRASFVLFVMALVSVYENNVDNSEIFAIFSSMVLTQQYF